MVFGKDMIWFFHWCRKRPCLWLVKGITGRLKALLVSLKVLTCSCLSGLCSFFPSACWTHSCLVSFYHPVEDGGAALQVLIMHWVYGGVQQRSTIIDVISWLILSQLRASFGLYHRWGAAAEGAGSYWKVMLLPSSVETSADSQR